MQSEVKEALKATRPGKAIGEDGIATEILEVFGEWGVMVVVAKIANCIYDTGRLPDRIIRSVFITISKKPGAVDCDNFGTMSVMSQLSKLVLRVVLIEQEKRLTRR